MRTPIVLTVLSLASASFALPDGLVTFNDGTGGWEGSQGIGGVGTFVDENEGNPAPGLHTVFNDFGITFRNSTNPEFVQDLSQVFGFAFGIDTKVNDIAFFGTPVPRPWLLELRDFDAGPNSDQFASVWYKFADISAATHGEWTRFFVQVSESDYGSMPAGWRGAFKSCAEVNDLKGVPGEMVKELQSPASNTSSSGKHLLHLESFRHSF